ncbi:uncharacterized protein B0I36DRAFT_343611 [Microdochium trichocladiopsis]|uniref:Uncharacterized protein n=1 Tax=Microdochium trichocladiopsis TaxID=1682393 RepID=A0A9P9BTA1_9PEZI|nr:uncharacterized protein B0I36DRAFT_343611 [Microdochium trichocladiopsis]KAH7039761.1 hypothetical protein B0I36DRAFT_343611 [Microdochium trichocladiopsis]
MVFQGSKGISERSVHRPDAIPFLGEFFQPGKYESTRPGEQPHVELLDFGHEADIHLASILNGTTELHSLGRLIRDYNRRRLTYDEDALPRTTGLLTCLSRTFHGGFICGLPQMFFDAALSWSPATGTNLRRRQPSVRPDNARLHPCHLPLWSWVGWHGAGQFSGREARSIPVDIVSHEMQETFPITT